MTDKKPRAERAATGRTSFDHSTRPIPCRLSRLRVDRDGYDRGGAYWGNEPGQHMYWLRDVDIGHQLLQAFVRAPNLAAARQTLSTLHPNAYLARERRRQW